MFANGEWTWTNSNSDELQESLTQEDKENFNFDIARYIISILIHIVQMGLKCLFLAWIGRRTWALICWACATLSSVTLIIRWLRAEGSTRGSKSYMSTKMHYGHARVHVLVHVKLPIFHFSAMHLLLILCVVGCLFYATILIRRHCYAI